LTAPGSGVTLRPMFGLGMTEILVIGLILALLFGARRLPELGSGLGKAIKNFKAGVTGKDEIDVTPQENASHEEVEEKNPTS